jgi:hypothetical protein
VHGLRLEEQEDGSADVTAAASATAPATATSAEAASPMAVAAVPTWTGREPGADRTEAGAAGTEARLESFRPASAAATTSARTARVTAVICLLFHPGLLPGGPTVVPALPVMPVMPVVPVVLVRWATVLTAAGICCAVSGTH